MRLQIIYVSFLFFFPALLIAQESEIRDTSDVAIAENSRTFFFNGYVKNMNSLSFPKDFQSLNATDLIHNRLNIKWMPFSGFSFTSEFRNRLIWGDDVRYNPGFGNFLRNPNEFADLSKTWFSTSSLILHTNIDRIYADYKIKRLGVRLGRQRINWGISTLFNPNDLFNTYNFLDFDYEERPGSDAIKLAFETGSFSGIELAYSPGNKTNPKVLAGKYFFNTRGYDIQILTGLFGNRFTAGLGWAGSIGNVGFKGETQAFSASGSEKVQFNLTLEADYIFKNGWYVNSAVLLNNNGIHSKILHPLQLNFTFSPANLMPTKWNFIIAGGKEITPLFSVNVSALYAPGTNLLLILPGLSYSLGDNLTADLIWQSFFASLEKFEALNHRGFLRIKLNF